MRFGQITFTTPLHCRIGRSTEFGMMLPAASNGSYKGTIFPVLSTSFLKSPFRNSSNGAVTIDVDWPFLVEARSYAKKKNALLRPSNILGRKIGPPTLPPGFHWRTIGRFDGAVVNPRALKTSLRFNTKTLP